MIHIQSNSKRIIEREYIFSYVFMQRFGLQYRLSINNDLKKEVIIELPNKEKITTSDIFFNTDENKWLKETSLLQPPFRTVNLSETPFSEICVQKDLPVLYSEEIVYDFIDKDDKIAVDIFGSMFFILSGYEEYIKPNKNQFNNFPYEGSIAQEANIIKRPIVDEYIELLWEVMMRKDSSLNRKKENYKCIPTHDIDVPFLYYFNPFLTHVKNSLGDIVKRKSLNTFVERNRSKFCLGKSDPFNTYEWLMDESEKNGLQSIFFFKNSLASSKRDFPYSNESPAMKKVLKKINERGHEIGLHPSFFSYNNEEMLLSEANGISGVCKSLGINQNVNKVRQHYLRYEIPTTTLLQEKCGFLEDYTLGYRDITGFRRGTCHPFPIFNVKLSKAHAVNEMSLILMEMSLFLEAESWENRYEKAMETMRVCKKYRGNFILLFHNNFPPNQPEFKEFYSSLIKLSR
jgi:hypothetical protein